MSVFEVRSWTDVRLSYDTKNEAKCVVGAGTARKTWIPLEATDFEGSDKLVLLYSLFCTVSISVFIALSLSLLQ